MASKKKKDKISDEIKKAFKTILKECKDEGREERKAQIKEWKRLEEYWRGIQHIFWSEREGAWLLASTGASPGSDYADDADNQGPLYDYVLNIYRAHGEAIISALSAKLPSLRFAPDDAEDSEDVITARTYSKIADLVQKHNNAVMVFLRGIFYLWNGGLVASYRYKDSDKKYGTYEVPEYDVQEQEKTSLTCPECNYSEPESQPELGVAQNTECPQCGSEMEPKTEKEKVPIQTGMQVLPKTRVKLSVFGPLQFKIPTIATKQDECSYILLFVDGTKSDIKSALIPDMKDCDLAKTIDGEVLESQDRFTKSGLLYPDDPEIEGNKLTTITQAWFRPSCYWKIKEENIRLELLEEYPEGVHVTFVGKQDHVVDEGPAVPVGEELDSRWDIGQAGLSTHIHSDPIGKPLLGVQDMENQVANMTMDVIDHGNPSSFADADAINFDQYGKTEALPGYLYKAKRRPGEAMAASFYTQPRVSLAKEVPLFKQQLDQASQFLVGSFPSIYGGPSEGKSRTFAEYQQSRAMALQRLQIVWQFIVDWWKRTMEGCVRMYVETVVQDERLVKFQDGSYINVWIRQSELKGKVGGVESDASDTFPISMMQKNALIQKLMELNNPFINSALYTPDNARIIQDVLALNEFKLPGETQRIKQVMELDELRKGQPEQTGPIADPMTGQQFPNPQPLQSSVPIDPDVDDHAVHIQTCKSFLVDQIGLDLKQTNPMGYNNCVLHMKAHIQALQAQTMQNQPGSVPGQQPQTTQGAPQ